MYLISIKLHVSLDALLDLKVNKKKKLLRHVVIVFNISTSIFSYYLCVINWWSNYE